MTSTPRKISIEKRRVGRTGLEVSALGFGTGAGIGGMPVDVPDDDARAAITYALDAGITYFDTAPQYGLGRSEHLTGDALRDRRQGLTLSTKVGRLLKPFGGPGERAYPHGWARPFPFDQVYDYSYGAIMRAHEDSLQRLALPSVDILYVHDIGTDTHGAKNAEYWAQLTTGGGGYRALQELKASGAIKAIGLGVNETRVLMDAFDIGDWDVFLLAGRYTLLEQVPMEPFFATCLKRGTSVVIGGPFNGGALMGNGLWNYAKAPQHIIDRVRQLEAFCTAQGVPIGAAALQFPLANPAVASIIPGPKSTTEIAGILDWWQTPIPDRFWTALADAKLIAPGVPLPGGRTA